MVDKYYKKVGIYKLTCRVNGKIYIGKSVSLNKRLNRHKNSERDLKGRSYLQNSIRKYGWDSFEVQVLETYENFDPLKDNSSLLERETYYIDLYDSTNKENGYNYCRISNDTTGIPLSEETKRKMSRPKHTEESKRRIGEATSGRKHSEESKEKMRKPKSGAHRENIRKASILQHAKRKLLSEKQQTI